jgi:hypothetical protein
LSSLAASAVMLAPQDDWEPLNPNVVAAAACEVVAVCRQARP